MVDAGEDIRRRVGVGVGHGLEDVFIHCIEAHRHSIQACFDQVGSVPFEQHAVGRHGKVDVRIDGSQHFDQPDHTLSQQRLTSGDSDLSQTGLHQGLNDQRNLLVRQQMLTFQKRMVGPEMFSRHAVRASKVASVGD